jgi:hypothetical protein
MPQLPRSRRAGTPFRTSFSVAPRELSFVGANAGQVDPARPRCIHCGRTPLVGELLHVYEATSGDRHVCELCRSRHREPPARSELVHSSEHHRAVKARTRAS